MNDYVWQRLSWRKHLDGRHVVDRLILEAMHRPIRYVDPDVTASSICKKLQADQSLGVIVLSYLLPYLAAEVIKLVLRWLDEAEATGPAGLPRIEG